MTKHVLVPIAPGTEEMEAITIIDTMIRAGFKVTTASVAFDGALAMRGSRGIPLTADCKLVDVADEEFDVIALPGGVAGAEIFRDSTLLIEMLRQHKYDGKLMAAICAAPALVLMHHKLYPDALMTCHPAFQSHIPSHCWRPKRVTMDVTHNLMTSQGPGSALEFSIEIIIALCGKEKAWEVAEPMVTNPILHYHEMGKRT
ncbi:oxidative-stress-resistance chaperone [Vibrio sp. 10N.286.49.C2]|uniref:DJ-1 family glyoxalase III n=1 Tax=unclassified Vibrio TaxID=2614977 RepID=UPI000C81FD85|nr:MULTISPECIES: DJ-1 family glyoxalase III [unclassified Vibrio]PMH38903.1 oxidative-stress-resistance chaperone [Vibrio sp. 10N.286.49.C2]PMH55378.1 oxidative-stress-resistance chaperone [Vibrio sp. 10N.286.49.B1]PMH82545.1 oxidative-stress-resistance chaperone [Vibrio sp. 10N.286.48.B7]